MGDVATSFRRILGIVYEVIHAGEADYHLLDWRFDTIAMNRSNTSHLEGASYLCRPRVKTGWRAERQPCVIALAADLNGGQYNRSFHWRVFLDKDIPEEPLRFALSFCQFQF